jgi:ribonuclease-3
VPTGRLEELQEKIGVAFRDLALLREALTHSSFANESPHVSPRDNERLEYLGDAVLQLITAEYLFKLRPGAKEGEMTQVRSAMVNTNTLASLGEELGLGEYLYLGKGIAKGGGRSLRSLLANAFEAVLGAIFLDAGYDASYHYYLDRFRALPEPVGDENHKGRLQQMVQERFGQTPYYDSAGARGGRQREYTAVVYAGADPLGTGHGTTKQAAEQEAARNAIAEIERRSVTRKSRQRRPEPVPEPPVENVVATPASPTEELAPSNQPPAPEPAASEEPQEPAAEAKPRRRTRRSRKAEEPPPPDPVSDRELAEAPTGSIV